MDQFYPRLVILLVVFFAIWLWFFSQRLIGKKEQPNSRAVFDRVHMWSAPLNAWLNINPRFANLLLVITSLVIDVVALFLIGSAIFGPSLKTFIALAIVLILRQMCHFISSLPAPQGIIWRYPGFPSLFVTYGVSNDFFFSGHTAIAVLGALQFMNSGNPWFVAAALVVVVIQITSMLVLRAHYTIDVFTAVIVALVANEIAVQIAPTIDFWARHIF